MSTSETRRAVTPGPAGHRQGRRRPPAAAFWCAWGLLLVVTVLLSWWAHGSSDLPLENRAARWLDYHHHVFPLSDHLWGYMRRAGQVTTVIVVALVVAAALAVRRHFVEAGLMLFALPMGLVQVGVRRLVDRPPFSGTIEAGRAYPSPGSFPSGHAFGEFLVFGLIFVFAPLIISSRAVAAGIRALCVAVIALGGLERVVDSRHWPSDVIGGYLLALLYVSAAWWVSCAWAAAADPNGAVAPPAA